MIYYNKDIIGCLKVLESKYLVDLMLDKFGCISWMFAWDENGKNKQQHLHVHQNLVRALLSLRLTSNHPCLLTKTRQEH